MIWINYTQCNIMSEGQQQFQQNPLVDSDSWVVGALQRNQVFSRLSISPSIIRQLAKHVEITRVNATNRITIDFEILLVLEGSVHEYVPNSWENILKNWENKLLKRQLLLFKKVNQNQFYTSYHPKYGHNKSQLIAQEGSTIIKISDDIFSRYFEKPLESYMKRVIEVLRGFDFTKSFKMETLYDLAKHVREERFREGTLLYQRGMVSWYFYFIKSGSVELFEKRPSRAEKGRYHQNIVMSKNNVVGLDGIITPTEGNKRTFSCEVLTNSQLLSVERRILIILICAAKERDISKQSYHQINLTDQFDHRARKSEITFTRSQLKQTMSNNFKSKTKSIIDILKYQNQMPMINRTPELISYESTEVNQFASGPQTKSQFLPQSRISIIRMGDNQQEEQKNNLTYLPSPRKSLSLKKRSVTQLKSNAKVRYRQQYRKQIQQLVEVKKMQEQNAKIKIVSKTKYDQRLKSTSRVKRILVCPKPQNEQNMEDVLFRKLEALNHNPLLLNFESNRKRLLLQMKKSVSK